MTATWLTRPSDRQFPNWQLFPFFHSQSRFCPACKTSQNTHSECGCCAAGPCHGKSGSTTIANHAEVAEFACKGWKAGRKAGAFWPGTHTNLSRDTTKRYFTAMLPLVCGVVIQSFTKRINLFYYHFIYGLDLRICRTSIPWMGGRSGEEIMKVIVWALGNFEFLCFGRFEQTVLVFLFFLVCVYVQFHDLLVSLHTYLYRKAEIQSRFFS